MKLPQDARFQADRLRYDLRFTCEDCAHFAQESCVHGFPTAEHRSHRYLSPTATLVFCKDFELA